MGVAAYVTMYIVNAQLKICLLDYLGGYVPVYASSALVVLQIAKYILHCIVFSMQMTGKRSLHLNAAVSVQVSVLLNWTSLKHYEPQKTTSLVVCEKFK